MTLKASEYNLICQRVQESEELASGLLVAPNIGTLQQYIVIDAGYSCPYSARDVIYAKEIEGEINYQGKKYFVISHVLARVE
jgi:hypothetical protein